MTYVGVHCIWESQSSMWHATWEIVTPIPVIISRLSLEPSEEESTYQFSRQRLCTSYVVRSKSTSVLAQVTLTIFGIASQGGSRYETNYVGVHTSGVTVQHVTSYLKPKTPRRSYIPFSYLKPSEEDCERTHVSDACSSHRLPTMLTFYIVQWWLLDSRVERGYPSISQPYHKGRVHTK